MKVIIEKEKGVFALKAEGIQTASDIQEVIQQLHIVEGQIVKKGCGIFSKEIFTKGTFTVQRKN